MSRARNYNPRTDELPDDDDEALAHLTGQLYDGDPVSERLRKKALDAGVERNCDPKTKRDREATNLFYERVAFHEQQMKSSEFYTGLREKLGKEADLLFGPDGPKSLDDLPEDLVVKVVLALMVDTRRPAVQLSAAKLVAQMKGMLGGGPKGDTEDILDSLLQAAEEREKKAKLRKVE